MAQVIEPTNDVGYMVANRIKPVFASPGASTTRKHINNWGVAHGAMSTQCARCRGTGVITLPDNGICPACNGYKYQYSSRQEIVRHISKDTARIEGQWFIMDECRWWLSGCASSATSPLY